MVVVVVVVLLLVDVLLGEGLRSLVDFLSGERMRLLVGVLLGETSPSSSSYSGDFGMLLLLPSPKLLVFQRVGIVILGRVGRAAWTRLWNRSSMIGGGPLS